MSAVDAEFVAPPQLDGIVVDPGHSDYFRLRSTYTTKFRPAAIVVARHADDIASAIGSARAQMLPISIRSGGHGMSGRGSNDGGVVVDLSAMNIVHILDRGDRLVRVEAGARWADVGARLASEGLAISSGDH